MVRCTHLEGLKLINHLLAHSDKVFKSLCKIVMSSAELMILYIKVSSAYSFTWDGTIIGRSLMYNRNKRGPRTEPWGTPDKTLIEQLLVLFSTTRCVLLVRKSLIHSSIGPQIP